MRHSHHKSAFFLLEGTAAMALIVMLLAAFAVTVTRFSNQHGVVARREQAVLASEAAMNEIRATGSLDVAAFENRYTGFRVTLQRSPGVGDWQGMDHFRVNVSTDARETRPIHVTLDGYIFGGDTRERAHAK